MKWSQVIQEKVHGEQTCGQASAGLVSAARPSKWLNGDPSVETAFVFVRPLVKLFALFPVSVLFSVFAFFTFTIFVLFTFFIPIPVFR